MEPKSQDAQSRAALFAVAPWPWTLFPALGHNDPAFVRDVNGKTVARAIPHADVAKALVAFVNGLAVPDGQ